MQSQAATQFELMAAVGAPESAWERFADDLATELRAVEDVLASAPAPARAAQLRHRLAELRDVIAAVSEKLGRRSRPLVVTALGRSRSE